MFEVSGVYYEKNGNTLTVCGPCENWDKDELILTDEINGIPITEIRAYAFQNVSGLKKVYIPRLVNKIGTKAFNNCLALETVVCYREKDSQSIQLGYQAFQNCEKLKHIKGGARLELVGDFVFYGCKSLENMPTCICGKIRAGTFMNCPNMRSLFMNYVTEVDDTAIDGNHGVQNMFVLKDFKYSKKFIELVRNVKIICPRESSFSDLIYDGFNIVTNIPTK